MLIKATTPYVIFNKCLFNYHLYYLFTAIAIVVLGVLYKQSIKPVLLNFYHVKQRQNCFQEDFDSDEDDAIGAGSDSDSDDDAELQRELARVREERRKETDQLAAEKKQQQEKIRMENIINGNPLLNKQSLGAAANDAFKVCCFIF